ncbi:4Fe-4S_ferredoxin iron-sulfur binding domain-containing protein [Hexamita inflata]|uniref:4Fe-4S ferredoxin iron-sulfur binding domain-containing protein n=1 Tax=Hexamita inflata TaxID=28002 RepID=A0AA86Q5R4_9EUKA|nr:4Fe-4S ferredoxin iron-sulfur binding domain-containing protein [Hexamita inflata]
MPAVATNLDACCGCQSCNVCPASAISYDGENKVVISADCVGCGACKDSCPCGVIEMQ